MLLIELTDGAAVHRISNEWLNLEHRWYPHVASLGSLKVSCTKIHGGYAKPVFGSLDLLPGLVAGLSYPITIKLTETNEAEATVIFTGTAHRTSEERDSIKYDLYGVDNQHKVTGVAYSGTLVAVFASACTTLGYTLDSSKARTPSPAVSYTSSGEKELLDNLSEMASFFCHGFTIVGTTLALFDMLGDTGSDMLSEFEYFKGSYTDGKPVSAYTSGNFSVDGLHSYGSAESISPACHTVQANVEASLADIKTMFQRRRIALAMPPEAIAPQIGHRLDFIDTSLAESRSISAWISAVVYDFDNHQFTVEGSAVLT